MSKRQPMRVSRSMAIQELPALMTTEEVAEYLQLGATKTYESMREFGTKVGALHRMPRERLREILFGAGIVTIRNRTR